MSPHEKHQPSDVIYIHSRAHAPVAPRPTGVFVLSPHAEPKLPGFNIDLVGRFVGDALLQETGEDVSKMC